jgi:hypothetical protein
MNRKRFEFEIYRPPKPTGRLVGDYAQDPKAFGCHQYHINIH